MRLFWIAAGIGMLAASGTNIFLNVPTELLPISGTSALLGACGSIILASEFVSVRKAWWKSISPEKEVREYISDAKKAGEKTIENDEISKKLDLPVQWVDLILEKLNYEGLVSEIRNYSSEIATLHDDISFLRKEIGELTYKLHVGEVEEEEEISGGLMQRYSLGQRPVFEEIKPLKRWKHWEQI